MSYPLDTAAQNAALDALLGDAAAATVPTAFEVALFNGDPSNGGVELSGGGYARASIANDSAHWPDAVGGEKTSTTVTFATSTGAWSDSATHWLLFDAADSTTAWFYRPLADEVDVSASGTVVEVELVLAWNTLAA